MKSYITILMCSACLIACGTSEPIVDAGIDATSDVSSDSPLDAVDSGPKSCVHNSECSGGVLCAHDYGTCGQPGTCTGYASNCVPGQVCGCDNQTYAGGCAAFVADVPVAYEGACE